MPDVQDFLPLRRESRQRIRARMDADVNVGLSPGDPRWLDTTEGGFYWDATQPAVLDSERQWDALSVEFPAVVFLPFAFGRYLDRHGEVLNVPRKAAAAATGIQRFIGAAGTLIPTGAEVAVPGVGENEPTTYLTTASDVIGAGGSVDLPIQASVEGTEGNAVPGAVSLPLTAIPGLTSITNPASITGGADVESDEAYKPRLLASYVGIDGAGTMDDHEQWATAYPGVGAATVSPEDPAPGFVRVVITDSLNDPVSQQVKDGLQKIVDPISASGVLNASTTLPAGTIVLQGAGSPTTGFLDVGYLLIGGSQVVRYTGRTANSFTGATGGTGTFPAGTSVVQSGRGNGLAPVGQRALIQTPALVTIGVVADLSLDLGYSIDGANGTNAVQPAIDAVVARYINGLKSGDDVILNKVESLLFDVRGVHDTANVKLSKNGGAATAANIAVATLEVPQMAAVTLNQVP